jgi:arylformamidase
LHEATVDLEAEYDNRANVPEHPAIMAGWERDATAFRAASASRSELSLRYGPHPRQTIDLFYPDHGDERDATVVFVHGGYWRSLGPQLFSHFAQGANAHGFAVALPGYRLCPEVSIGEIIEDVRAACLFLHRRFGRPMVACGHSAGGHLAAALAATDWAGAAPDVPATLVRRALAISGIFDLTPLLRTSVNESLRLNERTAAELSPAFWTPPPDAMIALRAGATETSEYHRQNRVLAERWGASGARVDTGVIAGANHFTAPAPLADPASELTQALLGLCNPAARQA